MITFISAAMLLSLMLPTYTLRMQGDNEWWYCFAKADPWASISHNKWSVRRVVLL